MPLFVQQVKPNNLLFTLLLILITAAITLVFTIDKGNWKVQKVTDGDSFTVSKGDALVEIRLYGIDCPEQTQPFYNKAGKFTKEMLQSRGIRIEAVDRDRYGRTVASIPPWKFRRRK